MLTPPHLRCEPLEDRTVPAGAGTFDPTFGVGGKVTVPYGDGLITFDAVAVQPDGRIVLAGYASAEPGNQLRDDFAAVRLNPDGSLDPTFGTGGAVVVPFDLDPAGVNNRDRATAVAVQPDGKVVLAGSAAPSGLALARLTPDGSLDPMFGTAGKVTFPLAPAVGLAIQPDGRIVAATPAGLIRLVESGQIDPTFGTPGTVSSPLPGMAVSGLALQPGGRVIVSGVVAGSSAGVGDLVAAGLTADGQLDPMFGDGGRVVVPFDSGIDNMHHATTVAVQPDGRVVLAGTVARAAILTGPRGVGGPTFDRDFAAARLTADGQLDPTFGTGGRVTVNLSMREISGGVIGNPTSFGTTDELKSVAVQPGGRVVLVGLAQGRTTLAAAVRLTPAGVPDPTFGSGGRAFGYFGTAAVAVQPDGKVVLPGVTTTRLLGEAAPTRVTPPAGPLLVGGRPDGTAVPYPVTAQGYQAGATITPFPGFPGTTRVATADVTGDGVPDHVFGAGSGGGPDVVIFDGLSNKELRRFFAFEDTFTGGVFVAAGDINGDGFADLVVTPDRGGGPVVAVYDGAALTLGAVGGEAQVARFFGIDDPDFRGGARPAIGDLNGDGVQDLIVSAGFLGGPRVAVFGGTDVMGGRADPDRLLPDFFAFEPTLRNGAFVAAGDVTGDGIADLAFGGGPGGAPRVRLFDGAALLAAGPFANLDEVPTAQRANFFAGDADLRGGVRLALRDADGDGRADLVAGSGEGEPSRVRVYLAGNLLALPTPTPDQELDPFGGAVLADGVFVG